MAAFDSNEYDWNALDLAINGMVLTKLQSVQYEESVETEILRGKGKKGFKVADGNYDISGNLEMLQSDAERLMLLTGNKGVLGLKDLTITIAFKDLESGRLSTRSIISARITKIGEPVKQGEMKIVVNCPFVALDLTYL